MILNQKIPTILFTNSKNAENLKNLLYIREEEIHVKSIVEQLYKQAIQSVIIEGGTKTLQTFIDLDTWDEARIFTADFELKKGTKAPQIAEKNGIEKTILNNKLRILNNHGSDHI